MKAIWCLPLCLLLGCTNYVGFLSSRWNPPIVSPPPVPGSMVSIGFIGLRFREHLGYASTGERPFIQGRLLQIGKPRDSQGAYYPHSPCRPIRVEISICHREGDDRFKYDYLLFVHRLPAELVIKSVNRVTGEEELAWPANIMMSGSHYSWITPFPENTTITLTELFWVSGASDYRKTHDLYIVYWNEEVRVETPLEVEEIPW